MRERQRVTYAIHGMIRQRVYAGRATALLAAHNVKHDGASWVVYDTKPHRRRVRKAAMARWARRTWPLALIVMLVGGCASARSACTPGSLWADAALAGLSVVPYGAGLAPAALCTAATP